MNEAPRYATLRDYLDALRRHRWLILAVALLFGGAAYAYTKSQDPVYTAESSLAVRDISQDVDLISSTALPTRALPETLAVSSAEQATRPVVAQRVKKALKSKLTIDQLRGMVTARAEARTAFVVFQAQAGTGRRAARLANEFARQFTIVTTRQERRRYGRAADSLRTRFRKDKGRRSSIQRQLYEERISRVQALQDFARPVETARRAEVPSTPTSPRPLRDTVLGLILGLTVGILLAFLRDALDRRMKGAHDIQEELGVPLLGYVSDKALGGGLLSLTGKGGSPEPDLEAFRILRANLDFLEADTPPRSFMVTSALPEEGKTTVAIALACVYAATGRRTLLLECDLRRSAFSNRLGIAPRPGLSDHLAGRAPEREIVQDIVLPWNARPEAQTNGSQPATPAGGPAERVTLSVVAAGTSRPNAAELLNSDRFRRYLANATRAYEVVIIDTAPLLPVVDSLELVPLVDAVLLCVRASRTTREQAMAAKAAIAHFPDRPVGLVTTGMRRGDAANYGYYAYSYSY